MSSEEPTIPFADALLRRQRQRDESDQQLINGLNEDILSLTRKERIERRLFHAEQACGALKAFKLKWNKDKEGYDAQIGEASKEINTQHEGRDFTVEKFRNRIDAAIELLEMELRGERRLWQKTYAEAEMPLRIHRPDMVADPDKVLHKLRNMLIDLSESNQYMGRHVEDILVELLMIDTVNEIMNNPATDKNTPGSGGRAS
jgi:hypothetical protein